MRDFPAPTRPRLWIRRWKNCRRCVFQSIGLRVPTRHSSTQESSAHRPAQSYLHRARAREFNAQTHALVQCASAQLASIKISLAPTSTLGLVDMSSIKRFQISLLSSFVVVPPLTGPRCSSTAPCGGCRSTRPAPSPLRGDSPRSRLPHRSAS